MSYRQVGNRTLRQINHDNATQYGTHSGKDAETNWLVRFKSGEQRRYTTSSKEEAVRLAKSFRPDDEIVSIDVDLRKTY